MSNGQTPMKPLVSDVNQKPAKLIQLQLSVATSGGIIKQPIKMVTTPQGMQNINRAGLSKFVITCIVYVKNIINNFFTEITLIIARDGMT